MESESLSDKKRMDEWDGLVYLQCFDEKTYDFGYLLEILLIRKKKFSLKKFNSNFFLFLLVKFL